MAHACVHPRRGILDQALDLPGRLRAALGQRAHLSRHDGKTLALFARARRFHGSVQRKNVGLEGNAVHHAHDLADAARAVGDALHALHHFLHRLAAALRKLRGAQRLAAGQVGIARGHLHRVRQLRHIGGGFLQRARLPRGPIRHVRAARSDLAGAGMDFFHPMAYRGHRGRQSGLHAAHGRIQHADLVVAAQGDGAGQIAVGDAVEVRAGLVQGPQDAAPERQPYQQGQQRHETQHGRRHQHDAIQRAAGARHGGLALFAGIGLIGLGLLDVGRAAGGQHLVRQAVDLDPVPAPDRLAHRGQRLVGESGVRREHLAEQRRAPRARVRVGAQPRQAGRRLLEQRVRLRQGAVARFLQPAFHGGLGVRQCRARLEQPAGHVRQIAGAFDAAAAQCLDIRAIVAQDGDARARHDGEQHHKQRKNGRQRRCDPKIFPHIHPCVAWPHSRQCSGLWTPSLAIS